jgi:hypothetical protein
MFEDDGYTQFDIILFTITFLNEMCGHVCILSLDHRFSYWQFGQHFHPQLTQVSLTAAL